METIHAIFENGVFRPVAPVSIPENTEVEFEPRLIGKDSNGDRARSESLQAVYEILSERYASGVSDTAERHNEHQPQLLSGRPRPLNEIMDEIGSETESRGLTPEILRSLLHDD